MGICFEPRQNQGIRQRLPPTHVAPTCQSGAPRIIKGVSGAGTPQNTPKRWPMPMQIASHRSSARPSSPSQSLCAMFQGISQLPTCGPQHWDRTWTPQQSNTLTNTSGEDGNTLGPASGQIHIASARWADIRQSHSTTHICGQQSNCYTQCPHLGDTDCVATVGQMKRTMAQYASLPTESGTTTTSCKPTHQEGNTGNRGTS